MTAGTIASPAAVGADAGQLVEANCTSCHGPNGLSTVATYPKLAGQQPLYVAKQLDDAANGKRNADEMKPCLAGAKSADPAALGTYFSAQPPSPAGSPADAALAEVGRKLFEEGDRATGASACASCHQAGAVGSEKHPRLAGQHRDYIMKQIRRFRAGERTNDKGRQMRNVAVKLTDEEIAAAAEYLSSL
jgi:cytochrome c553